MSKKKQPPRMPVKKEAPIQKQPEKKSVKGIIIAVAAIILVAAAVVAAVFLINPSENTKTETTTKPKSDLNISKTEHTFVDYKGAQLPQEFVDILNQAEIDSKAACKAQGVALEIGDIEISKPEFMSYYYDQYTVKKNEVQYSIEQKGSNMTGFDPEIMPDEQDCLNKGYTWAEDFTRKAIAEIQSYYRAFDRALEEGMTMTDAEIDYVIAQYGILESASRMQQKSVEELVESIYGEGYTADMYRAREIMYGYMQKYEEETKGKLAESYSENELQTQLKGNPDAYKIVVGRVYPIEGEFDAVEVSKISTEEEFLEYAQKNFPGENYDAEVRTRCHYSSRKSIGETFGGEVGNWMFSDDRVDGEIGLVQGQLFRYLVYVEKKAYLNVSRRVLYYGEDYAEDITEEDKKTRFDGIKAAYDAWKSGDATEEGFENLGGELYDVRIGDLYYVLEEWIFDEARKEGDSTLIDLGIGYGGIYYLGENEGDYDWEYNMRTDKAEEDYLAAYERDIEKNYKEHRKDSAIKKVQKDVNVILTRKLAEEKKDK